MQGKPVARLPRLGCQPHAFLSKSMCHHAHLLATEKASIHVSSLQPPDVPRQWPSHRNHTRDIMCRLLKCQVAVVVHCQHTVEGHPSGSRSSGKPWDGWFFSHLPLGALPCLPRVLGCLGLPWEKKAILSVEIDWDEGPRGAGRFKAGSRGTNRRGQIRATLVLTCPRLSVPREAGTETSSQKGEALGYQRDYCGPNDLDRLKGRSDPPVTCKSRRTPRVNPGSASWL